MKSFKGQTLSWDVRDSVIELTLDHAPANEIGLAMLEDLEKFSAALESLAKEAGVCIISRDRKSVV